MNFCNKKSNPLAVYFKFYIYDRLRPITDQKGYLFPAEQKLHNSPTWNWKRVGTNSGR